MLFPGAKKMPHIPRFKNRQVSGVDLRACPGFCRSLFCYSERTTGSLLYSLEYSNSAVFLNYVVLFKVRSYVHCMSPKVFD